MPLTPKATDILMMLVEHRGRLVEKADLMAQAWPDTIVEESNLTQNIYTLRRALGDPDAEGPFIETVPRRGYRFVAPVREAPDRRADPRPGSSRSRADGSGGPGANALTRGLRPARRPSLSAGLVTDPRDAAPGRAVEHPRERVQLRRGVVWPAAAVAVACAAGVLAWAVSNRFPTDGAAAAPAPSQTRLTNVGVSCVRRPSVRLIAFKILSKFLGYRRAVSNGWLARHALRAMVRATPG